MEDNCKLSKLDRRLMKKTNRKKHILYKNDGIKYVNSCTKYIVIANAGLGNGMDREELYEILTNAYDCDIANIYMPRNKAYSIVSFANESDATKMFDSINGMLHKCPLHTSGITFYPSFIDTVPLGNDDYFTQSLPPGLIIIENFVSQDIESSLLIKISNDMEEYGQNLKNRRVLHYGYEFVYGINNIARENPLSRKLPEECDALLDTLLTRGILRDKPDQLTVNEYLPGQGIPPHVDTHSACEDCIVSISLGSHIVMEFRHPDSRQVPVLLAQRSALIMKDESRYVWSHGIMPRKADVVPQAELSSHAVGQSLVSTNTDALVQRLTLLRRQTRISLTFRKVLHGTCQCNFIEYCDHKELRCSSVSSTKPEFKDLTEEEAVALEKEHVYKVYENIASHFSDTRHTAWPQVTNFLHSLEPYSLIADIGCGNGKYLAQSRSCYMIGSDRSNNLCDICRQRQFEVFSSDILGLPLRSNVFDAAICIAVIHHLSTKERRLRALNELVRILKRGGLLLVYVWALEQETSTNGMSNYLSANRLKKKKQLQEDVEVSYSTSSAEIGASCSNNFFSNDKSLRAESDVSYNRLITAVNQEQLTAVNQNQLTVVSNHNNSNLLSNSPCLDLQGLKDNNLIKENSKDDVSSTSLLLNKLQLPVHVNRTNFDAQDVLVPWHLKGKKGSNELVNDGSVGVEHTHESKTEVNCRYYHVFHQAELQTLCSELIYAVQVKDSYYDKGNWCVILEKL